MATDDDLAAGRSVPLAPDPDRPGPLASAPDSQSEDIATATAPQEVRSNCLLAMWSVVSVRWSAVRRQLLISNVLVLKLLVCVCCLQVGIENRDPKGPRSPTFVAELRILEHPEIIKTLSIFQTKTRRKMSPGSIKTCRNDLPKHPKTATFPN